MRTTIYKVIEKQFDLNEQSKKRNARNKSIALLNQYLNI